MKAGVIWALDSRSFRELDNRFNPCSVSTSATGDVFIADNGADRVSKMTDMSHLFKCRLLLNIEKSSQSNEFRAR